jgi:hypothetical protein
MENRRYQQGEMVDNQTDKQTLKEKKEKRKKNPQFRNSRISFLVVLVGHLFFQCIVMCRRLLWARGSGCQSFSSLWCFPPAKSVSSFSARSLIPGAHAVCVCVPVVILDLTQ